MENKDKKLCESTDYTSDDWVRVEDNDPPCISFDKEYECIKHAQFRELAEESAKWAGAQVELKQLRARVASLENENDRTTAANNWEILQNFYGNLAAEEEERKKEAFYNDISSIRDSLNELANR